MDKNFISLEEAKQIIEDIEKAVKITRPVFPEDEKISELNSKEILNRAMPAPSFKLNEQLELLKKQKEEKLALLKLTKEYQAAVFFLELNCDIVEEYDMIVVSMRLSSEEKLKDFDF